MHSCACRQGGHHHEHQRRDHDNSHLQGAARDCLISSLLVVLKASSGSPLRKVEASARLCAHDRPCCSCQHCAHCSIAGLKQAAAKQVGDQGAIDSKRGEAESLLNEVPDLPAGGKVKEEITVSSDKQVPAHRRSCKQGLCVSACHSI